mmetsp:Transcript_5112/g.15225  ORF Transcript_5112/g.15225 Transcript_5112/m.15225 type:complete len:420 (+) Transcript_5112:55-1314(+)
MARAMEVNERKESVRERARHAEPRERSYPPDSGLRLSATRPLLAEERDPPAVASRLLLRQRKGRCGGGAKEGRARLRRLRGVLEVVERALRHQHVARVDARVCVARRDVHIVPARVVRLPDHRARHRVAAADGDRRLEQRAHLVPVRERLVWPGRELDLPVRAREAAVEPEGETVELRHARHHEAERQLELLELAEGHRREIELERRRRREQRVRRDGPDDGLREVEAFRRLLQRAQVDAVEACLRPKVELLLLLGVERRVGERRRVQHRLVGVHLASRLEEPVPRHEVRLEHPLVDERDAERLRDEDVDALVELDVLHALVQHAHLAGEPVRRGQLLRVPRHARRLDGKHASGAGAGGEEGEDARARADVEHALAPEVRRVLQDGELVDGGAHLVLQHALLLHERRVVVEVHLVLVRR